MRIKSLFSSERRFGSIEQITVLKFTIKWSLLASILGLLAGTASAALLVSLNWVTAYRESHLPIILFLPIAGLVIGLMYYYWGKGSERGNNYLIDEVHSARNIIPFRMAPLAFIGTLLTHLFGGSAGREGTAVQMGGAISEKLAQLFRLKTPDRRIFLIIGVSAGFASVFGTPLAGAVFALEVLIIGRMRYEAILPSFMAAIVAHFTCSSLWGVHHTSYAVGVIPEITPINLVYVLLAGILFGLSALLFSRMVQFWTKYAKRLIKYSPFRPLVGGIILVCAIYVLGTTKYIGLGIPTIVSSFLVQEDWYSFLIKIILTTFTLGVGFKGGEVTPLFFIGATLGSALSGIIPMPIGILAAVGFVAVFSGATNTPLACTIMGMELFGTDSGVFVALGCVIAYLFSGHSGIYASQIIGSPKLDGNVSVKGKLLRDLEK